MLATKFLLDIWKKKGSSILILDSYSKNRLKDIYIKLGHFMLSTMSSPQESFS